MGNVTLECTICALAGLSDDALVEEGSDSSIVWPIELQVVGVFAGSQLCMGLDNGLSFCYWIPNGVYRSRDPLFLFWHGI